MQYTAFRDGKSIGTFSHEQLKDALAVGVLRPTDTYFGEGMASIQTLSQLQTPSTPAPSAPSTAIPQTPKSDDVRREAPRESAARIDWDTLPSGPVPSCCSRCKSSDIKAVQLVYKMGQSSGSMAGMSLSGEVGIATTHNISDLAAELAPPAKGGGTLAIFVFGWAVAAVLGLYNTSLTVFYLIGALTIIGTIAFAIANSRAFAKSYYLWRNRWICFKCGHKFVSIDASALEELRSES